MLPARLARIDPSVKENDTQTDSMSKQPMLLSHTRSCLQRFHLSRDTYPPSQSASDRYRHWEIGTGTYSSRRRICIRPGGLSDISSYLILSQDLLKRACNVIKHQESFKAPDYQQTQIMKAEIMG